MNLKQILYLKGGDLTEELKDFKKQLSSNSLMMNFLKLKVVVTVSLKV
jgi:hypothetical protein